MRISAIAFAFVCLCASASAGAHCYSMYDGQNRLVYRSAEAPVDMSRPLSETMEVQYPGRTLVVAADDIRCVRLAEAEVRPTAGRKATSKLRSQPFIEVPGSNAPVGDVLRQSPLFAGW